MNVRLGMQFHMLYSSKVQTGFMYISDADVPFLSATERNHFTESQAKTDSLRAVRSTDRKYHAARRYVAFARMLIINKIVY